MKYLRAQTSRLDDYLVATVLAVVPFHAFLTVWVSSAVGHYLLLRLWDDFAMLALAGIVGYWLATDKDLRQWVASSLLVRLVAAYVGLSILLGLVALTKGAVTPRALCYGLLINLRFLVWFVAVLLVAQRSLWLRQNWAKLVLVPAAVVVAFGTLQYIVLPHDFLSHFGYNVNTTIAPIETINHNPAYIRVQSTLRGANPLGAYLVLVVSTLAVLYARGKRRVVCAVFGAVALFALFASSSRSAWIGAVMAVGAVALTHVDTKRRRIIFASACLVGAVLLAGAFLLVRDNVSVQNQLLHTQHDSVVDISSNDAHASALATGVKDVLQQPLGDGPGTAGPASIYNAPNSPRVAENYFVQIAQETGWLGLALFLSILTLVALELYGRIRRSRLALMLLASLVGISFINLVSHAWTDGTLAYLWWGLAGIALAVPESVKTRETDA